MIGQRCPFDCCFPAVEFLWSHTTESMCVGYMSAQDSKAKVSFQTHSSPTWLDYTPEPTVSHSALSVLYSTRCEVHLCIAYC